jgi:hypothetical protein
MGFRLHVVSKDVTFGVKWTPDDFKTWYGFWGPKSRFWPIKFAVVALFIILGRKPPLLSDGVIPGAAWS